MAPINIQSQDYRDLLDIIDKLRSEGLGRYVDLPEIIVCGDQSSGKSSVLEAISGLSFPTKDNLCTRFATELILRRNPVPDVRVSIVPHHSRSGSEKAKLSAFTAKVDPDHPDIGPVVEAAKVAMGLADIDDNANDGKSTKRFSNDVLRVELSGLTQQHLTLVDLPGLFQAGNAEQSAAEAPVVRKLVLGYMKRPRSIILAVVSAAYDFANQAVTQFAREVDPRGARTMGLITKPDKLDRNSDSERAFVRMAANRDVALQLGWHVLKNRDFSMRDATAAQRDEAEASFFFPSSGGSAWSAVNPAHLGIGPLRPRLSTILKDQILSQLPTMLGDIEALLEECNLGLARLGTPRATVFEQRQYLSRVSGAFTQLMDAAVNGSYTDTAFFGTVAGEDGGWSDSEEEEEEGDDDKGYERRLRAVVQNRLTRFARDMHHRGQTRRIVGDDSTAFAAGRRTVKRGVYIDEVRQIIAKSRGRELPGTFNPLVVGDLFRSQCKPWEELTTECTESVLQSAFKTITAALEHTTVEDTANRILQSYVNPAMDALKQAVADQTKTLMAPQTDGHPITYNHYLTENVQKARNARLRESFQKTFETHFGTSSLDKQQYVQPSALLAQLVSDTEPNMERVAASDAIDYMEAYYKVALKRFVDDVSILVVEHCLVRKLPSLFTSDMIYDISDEDVSLLAGETSEAVAERARLTEKKATLESGLHELRRLDKHRSPVPYAPSVEPASRSGSALETTNGVEMEEADSEPEPPEPETMAEPPVEAALENDFWTRVVPKPEPVPVPEKEALPEPLAEEDWAGFIASLSKKKDKKKKKAGYPF